MEIGSEYNISFSKLKVQNDNLFGYLSDYNTIYTSSGRGAIRIIAKKFRSVLLPEFICESVIKCFGASKISFYKINNDCTIDVHDLLHKITSETDCVFIMHYFGAVQPKQVLDKINLACKQNGIGIIEDVTHSILSTKSTIGDYMVASLRKWFPLPNGGVLYSKNQLDADGLEVCTDNAKTYAMALKDLYLFKGYDFNSAYRKIFAESEQSLQDNPEPKLISDFSKFILSCQSVSQIIEKRKTNYKNLAKKLAGLGLYPVVKLDGGCPFVLPLRVKHRDVFRKYLIDNRIYCAVHWPKDEFSNSQRSTAELNSDTLISLPIDQRYGGAEIEYIFNTISSFGGELKF